jgi:hypothetical protein
MTKSHITVEELLNLLKFRGFDADTALETIISYKDANTQKLMKLKSAEMLKVKNMNVIEFTLDYIEKDE